MVWDLCDTHARDGGRALSRAPCRGRGGGVIGVSPDPVFVLGSGRTRRRAPRTLRLRLDAPRIQQKELLRLPSARHLQRYTQLAKAWPLTIRSPPAPRVCCALCDSFSSAAGHAAAQHAGDRCPSASQDARPEAMYPEPLFGPPRLKREQTEQRVPSRLARQDNDSDEGAASRPATLPSDQSARRRQARRT